MILGATLRLKDNFTNVMKKAHQITDKQEQSMRAVQTVTGGVQKSITSLNAQLRVHQSELRESMHRLDGNKNSLEALRVRSESYTKQLDIQRQRIEVLTSRYRRMASAHGEESTQATRAAAALARARAQQASMERQLRETTQEIKSQSTAMGRLKRDFDDMRSQSMPGNRFEAMSGAGAAVTGVGMASAVGLGAMFQSSSELIVEQGKLQASLGVTQQQAEKLGNMARNVWKQGFGESVGEVTQALLHVRKNMNIVDSELVKATSSAMTIAQVFDQDVNEVTAAAGVMMKNFGISGQQAMDLITVGFQRGGDFSGELLDTLREYSPQFKSLGLSADQAMAMMIAGTQAGAWNLDKVGDSMKEFNLRAQDGSKTTMEGFTAIGLDAGEMGKAIAQGGETAQKAFQATIIALANMKDPLAQNQAGVALFGTQWEDVRSQVVIAMADGMKGLDNYKGATDAATKAMQDNNPALAMTQAMRSMREAVAPAAMPIADILNNTIVPALKSVAEWFGNLSPEMQKTIVITAAVATGFALIGGPMLLLIGFLPMIANGLGMVGNAFKLLRIAAINPVTIGLTALIAVGVLLYKNWDTIKAKAGKVWENVKQTITNFIDNVITKFNEFKERVTKIWDDIKSFLKNPIKGTVNLVEKAVKGKSRDAKSHAAGLAYVPYDNYPALLHKGEAVLTRVEADQYRKQQTSPKETITTIQKIRQQLMPADMPTAGDMLQTIVQKLTPVNIPNPEELVQKIKQQLIPATIPKPHDILQTLKQQLVSVETPNPADLLQTIKQQLIPANAQKPSDLIQTIRQKLLPTKMPTTFDTYQNIYQKLIQPKHGGYETLLNTVSETKPETKTKNEGNKLTIKKLAETIVVREEADIDKITDKLEQKLLRVAANMGGA